MRHDRPEPSPTLSSSLSSIGADIPFLSPGSTGPKPTDNLIRAHTKVLIAMCYQLTQIETTATYFLIGAIGGGLLMVCINGMLIHQCFMYGIHVLSNFVGIAAVIIISIIIALETGYVLLDILYFPHDNLGVPEQFVFLYMELMRIAFESNDIVLRGIVRSMHKKMQCCGFFSVSDFYTSWQLDYPSDLEKDGNSTEPNMNTFRMSNSWVLRCSQMATQLFNSSHICYAPSFCCRGQRKAELPGVCPPAKWEGRGELKVDRSMYSEPCVWRIARAYRNKYLNITLFSLMVTLVATVNALHMWHWKKHQKSKSLLSSFGDSEFAAADSAGGNDGVPKLSNFDVVPDGIHPSGTQPKLSVEPTQPTEPHMSAIAV
ncbi:hypothetical protein Q1695_011101 [Nippostrongylus brasiliensis]|nr:hypothetical protein Q1695_011101 [Nippostrongylus brasiliensis]